MRTRGATTELRCTSVCLCTHPAAARGQAPKPPHRRQGRGHGALFSCVHVCVHVLASGSVPVPVKHPNIINKTQLQQDQENERSLSLAGTSTYTQHIRSGSTYTCAQPIFPALASGRPCAATLTRHAGRATRATHALPCSARHTRHTVHTPRTEIAVRHLALSTACKPTQSRPHRPRPGFAPFASPSPPVPLFLSSWLEGLWMFKRGAAHTIHWSAPKPMSPPPMSPP